MRLAALVLFALACLSTMCGGCATIVHGSSQVVEIRTEPAGATVRLDNGSTYTTPASVKLERKKDYVLSISKDGYQTQTVPLNSVLSGWLVGNIVFGGLIGGGVDAISGAAYTLTPENISIALTPLAPGSVDPGAGGTLQMTTQQKLDALEKLKAQGVVTDKEYEASKAKLTEQMKAEVTKTG